MPRVVPLLLGATLLLAGCATAASGKPTTVALAKYTDPTYHFSFSYSTSWKAPKQGNVKTISGTQTYVVDLTVPSGSVGMEVTVDKDLISYSTIPEGKVAPDPNGGPLTYHYHHTKVSDWPAIQIERFHGTTFDSIDTIANTRQYSYDIRAITGTPPFSASFMSGYQTIVKTMKLPF